MKKLINSLFALAFVLLLSTSIFAQEKPEHKHSDKTMTKSVEHKCTSECQEKGCDYVKAKEMKAAHGKSAKHVCTDECKTIGCAAVDAKVTKASSAKHVCTAECKTEGCDFVKAQEARASLDLNKDGSIYECPMKCEAGDKAGECSKCGMELKKVSVKS